MFTGYLKIEAGVRLFYKVYASTKDGNNEIASGQPTLIFLHGGPGVVDHTLYEPFWSKLAGKEMMSSTLQVIFIDQRGCGRSYYDKDEICDYGNSETWNLNQWGKDIHTFFTAFNLKKPIIAGVSFGGVVAMSCAVQFPTALGGLILSDTDAHFDLDIVISHFAEKVTNKGGNKEEVARVCNAAKRMFTETTEKSYTDYVNICIPYCAANLYNANLISRCIKKEEVAHHYNRNELTRFNFLPDLKKIECQTLVMAGDQSPVHTAKSAAKTAEALQQDRLTFKLFHSAGSPVYADKEEEVLTVIYAYLDKLSTYA